MGMEGRHLTRSPRKKDSTQLCRESSSDSPAGPSIRSEKRSHGVSALTGFCGAELGTRQARCEGNCLLWDVAVTSKWLARYGGDGGSFRGHPETWWCLSQQSRCAQKVISEISSPEGLAWGQGAVCFLVTGRDGVPEMLF